MSTTKPNRTRKMARAAAGHWRCDICAEDHPNSVNVCLMGGVNPTMFEPDRTIVELLCKTEGALHRWNVHRKLGAHNDALAQSIRSFLREYLIPAVNVSANFTAVWDAESVADGQLIELWLLDESEQAAIANWLEKAKAVYPEATWETAKDSGMQCVKQGLYSKCFATGFPCRPTTTD